jgi:hypothetical protein
VTTNNNSNGNSGSTVQVVSYGGITTYEDGGDGILAQSIGGGGGNGKGKGFIVRYGTDGGTGGSGDTVYTENGGAIATNGWQASGIIAQSIGGGGGAGGSASGFWSATGGSGGGGGNGGNVTVQNDGSDAITAAGDDSFGILAQSIGGGGGVGGKGSSKGLIASVGVGGSGGSGGNGGTALVSDYGNIITGSASNLTGSQSDGILAQSIGGGGGSGGAAVAEAVSGILTVTTAVGGSGGIAGVGGPATVNIGGSNNANASVTTYGADATGAVAQSIGGGGGAGGQSSAHSLSLFGSLDIPTITVSVGVGGNAGNGSNAGTAQISVLGKVTTAGPGADGLLAQSIGGGGGLGGDSTALASAAFAPAGSTSVAVSTAVGGTGGGTGTGGDAVAGLYANPNWSTSIITLGDHANGIVAQSIGGGGGIGGIGDATTKVPTKTIGLTADVAVGGKGGDGGFGDMVQVTSMSGISTAGQAADGIIAQSIGGGGGLADGGTAGLADATAQSSGARFQFNLGIGGSGGKGGPGGNVGVNNGALISTTGDSSDGILAQSIGGGGGEGGSAAPKAGSGGSSFLDYIKQIYGVGSAIYKLAQASSLDQVAAFINYDLSVDVGGSGGSGGNGGQVAVADVAGSGTAGSISTSGDLADGIVAQSIGGGGGAGGAATTDALKSGYQNFTASLDLSLGGSGGSSGSGGSVGVTHGVQGNEGYIIQTSGTQAIGIIAQSIGGGGGIGGSGGVVGGGTINLGASLSGSGSGSGNGNTAAVNNYGAIETTGNDSLGILAQSIGGGGGLAATAANTPGSSTTIGYTVTLGGGGGAAGNAGQVTVTDTIGNGEGGLDGEIKTSGDRAHGIVAQSIGGGGGGGYAGSGSAGANSFNYRIGAQTSTGAQGGPVSVTLNGNGFYSTNFLNTSGNGAYGVIAQSVGGGGGIGGDQTQPLMVGLPSGTQIFSHGNGDGGTVSVTLNNSAYVVTNGSNATAIFAQSVGGGGGLINGGAGSAGGQGSGGYVDVELNYSRVAANNGGDGIFAQSLGQESVGIEVALNQGSVVQGGNGGSAIFVSGGNIDVNQIYINESGVEAYKGDGNQVAITLQGVQTGILNILGEIKGQIVSLDGGGAAVENYGTIAFGGNSSVAYLNNNAGGILEADGVANVVTGTVTLNPGSQVLIAANFLQKTAAQLNVSQGLVLNGGTVAIRPSLLAPQTVHDIITAGYLGNEDALEATADDPVYRYTISRSPGGARSSDVTPSADFTPAGEGLNGDETSVAKLLQADWNHYLPGAADDASLAQVFGSLAEAGTAYPTRLSDLAAEGPGTITAAALASAQGLMGTLQSCPDFPGPDALLQEQDCVWERNTARQTNIYASTSYESAAATSMMYQLGGQKQIAPGWFLGGTVGLEQNWERAGGGLEKASGTGGSGGVILKWLTGPWTLSGAVAGGGGSESSTRVIDLPGFSAVAQGSPNDSYLLERLRAAYEFAGKNFYLKPSLNLDAVTLNQASYQEYGAGVYDLGLAGTRKTLFGVSPQAELGMRINETPNLILHPALTLGVTALSDDKWKTNETLLGQSFAITTPLPSLAGNAALKLDVLDHNGFELKLQYGLDITGISLSQNGYLRVGYRF